MKNIIVRMSLLLSMMVFLSATVFAGEENDDLSVFGLEVEKLLNLGTGLLALGVLVPTVLAYRRTENKRLLFVSIAFLLFAVRALVTAHELILDEIPWIDPVASALNFAIILFFFLGVLKK